MSETYILDFTSYQNNPLFCYFTSTNDKVTFYQTDTINFNNKNKNDE